MSGKMSNILSKKMSGKMSARWIDFTLTYCLMILAASIIFTGCVTEKKRLKICQSCPLKIERKDSVSVHDSIRMVPYAVPGPSFAVSMPNPCSDLCDSLGKLKTGFRRTVPTKGGSASIYTQGDSLKVQCNADSLKGEIEARDRTISRLIQITEQVPARCNKDCLNDWERLYMMVGKWTLIYIVAAIIIAVIWWRFR